MKQKYLNDFCFLKYMLHVVNQVKISEPPYRHVPQHILVMNGHNVSVLLLWTVNIKFCGVFLDALSGIL